MKKKLLLGILIGCVMVTGVLAIWIVSITTTATYQIESQAYGGLVINQELLGSNFNSLNGSVGFIDEFIFTNEGPETEMEISISMLKSSTDPGCINWGNDCEIKYYFHNGTTITPELLSNGSYIRSIPSGESKIVVDVSCVQYSCPQDIIPTISIQKIAN